MEAKNLCLVFPGVGYTVDKPLLYYAGKLYKQSGYEIVFVSYKDLPKKIGRDKEKMKQAFEIALKQAEEQLEDIKWSDYSNIVFVGKSIGTAISAAYAKAHVFMAEDGGAGNDVAGNANISFIYLTPLEDTFAFTKPSSGIAFHGTADPWADTEKIERLCETFDIPLYEYDDANHSLETGNVAKDLEIISQVIEQIKICQISD